MQEKERIREDSRYMHRERESAYENRNGSKRKHILREL